MTLDELDEEVARQRGWTTEEPGEKRLVWLGSLRPWKAEVGTPAQADLAALVHYRHSAAEPSRLPRYSASWFFAGPLLEEMAKEAALSMESYADGNCWFYFNGDELGIGQLNFDSTAEMPEIIARAWLAWRQARQGYGS